jgi:membrane associated rhomboid family serine protease
MFPLRDVIPSRTFPIVTVTFIAINTVVWFYELTVPNEELALFLDRFGVVPSDFKWRSIVTSMFLHGGWMHVIGNMWWLWIFGDNVEDRMGHFRFIVFYFLCGGLAAFGQTLMSPNSVLPMVGASGAIAGVLGAYLVLYPTSRVLTLIPLFIFIEIIELPAILLLGLWFVMQLFNAGAVAMTAATHGGGVAFMAHAVGFAAGVIGVFLFRQPERRKPRWT